jgi:hypothetical protein
MLKRAEFTCISYNIFKDRFSSETNKYKWKNIYLKLHTALDIHNKMTFQLKHLE